MGLFSTNKNTNQIDFLCKTCGSQFCTDSFNRIINYPIYGDRIVILYITTCPDCGKEARTERIKQ